jgi:hypothetical protein
MTIDINYDRRAAWYVVRVNGVHIGAAPTRRDADELAAHYLDAEQTNRPADVDTLDYITARSETA